MNLFWDGFKYKNRLIDHGPIELRRLALDILEYSIHSADPYTTIKELVVRDKEYIIIGDLIYDLSQFNRVIIVGAGKATQPIVKALEELLYEKLTLGLIAVKNDEVSYLEKTNVIMASHPIPDESSLVAAKEVVKIAKQANRRDLVIATFTGGSSSLFVYPSGNITLREKQELNRILLGCGAPIQEINAVRKHVSRVKGGRLGELIFPATLINLTVSDVIGDPLDCITDPTVPDTSTYQLAWNVMDKYQLWDKVSPSIKQHLKKGSSIETPKEYNYPYHSFIAIKSDAAAQGAARRCKELGYETYVLSKSMEGESRNVATLFAKKAIEIANSLPPNKRLAFIASGETTVTLGKNNCGLGGRNQEFALSAAFAISGLNNIVVASLATDGTDGPTNACGGLVDGETIGRAKLEGKNPEEALELHQSKQILESTGDLLVSGPTYTNVNDVVLIIIHT